MQIVLKNSKPLVNEIKNDLRKINKFTCDINEIQVVVSFKNGSKYVRHLEKY